MLTGKRRIRMEMHHARGRCLVDVERLAKGSRWLECTIVEDRAFGSAPVFAHPAGDDGEATTVRFRITGTALTTRLDT